MIQAIKLITPQITKQTITLTTTVQIIQPTTLLTIPRTIPPITPQITKQIMETILITVQMEPLRILQFLIMASPIRSDLQQ